MVVPAASSETTTTSHGRSVRTTPFIKVSSIMTALRLDQRPCPISPMQYLMYTELENLLPLKIRKHERIFIKRTCDSLVNKLKANALTPKS